MNSSTFVATSAPFLATTSDQFISCAWLCVIHTGCQYCFPVFHSQEGEGSWGSFFKHLLHTNAPWYTARSTCWRSASDVGGMCLMDLFPFENFSSCLIHSSIGTIPWIHQNNKMFKSFWRWGSYLFFAGCKLQEEKSSMLPMLWVCPFLQRKRQYHTLWWHGRQAVLYTCQVQAWRQCHW